MNWKQISQRLKNPGTVIGLAGLVGLLLMQFGVKVDIEWVDKTIKLICAISVMLGVMNNSETDGLDLPIPPKKGL